MSADADFIPDVNTAKGHVPAVKNSLLIVFAHGFKGDDQTFLKFPERVQNILSETVENCSSVDCVVFPVYETKGELNEAVVRFSEWLTTLVVEKEVDSGGGAGSVFVVLCGHSMGGLLTSESLFEFMKSRPDETAPLWPRIIACISFDTPYLGLHPYVFKNSVTKVSEYASAVQKIGSAVFGSFAGAGAAQKSAAPAVAGSSSGWGKLAAIGGTIVAAGAVAGGAYYKRNDLTTGYAWTVDHMKYVQNLWDTEALEKRLDELVDAEENFGVMFRTFYTLLPPSPPTHISSRTFIMLPKSTSRAVNKFIPAKNRRASDEIQAHTGMFGPQTNDGYYDLGLQFSKFVREATLVARGIVTEESMGAETN